MLLILVVIYVFTPFFFFFFFFFLTIYAVREHLFTVLIFSKYLVLEFWLRNKFFFEQAYFRFHDKKQAYFRFHAYVRGCDFNKAPKRFLEIALLHGCSPAGLLHASRASFLEITTGGLRLNTDNFIYNFQFICFNKSCY